MSSELDGWKLYRLQISTTPHKIQCRAKCKFNFGMISQSHECQHHKIMQNRYNEKTSIPKTSHVSSTKDYISTWYNRSTKFSVAWRMYLKITRQNPPKKKKKKKKNTICWNDNISFSVNLQIQVSTKIN